MSNKIFNMIAVLILIFIAVFLPLKMSYYGQEIDYADKQMQEDVLPGQN